MCTCDLQWCKYVFIPPVARDDNALSEFSLVNGGDDFQTQEMLGNEIDRFMGHQGGGGGGEGERGEEGGERREGEEERGERREGEEERGGTERVRLRPPKAVKRVDPGMSVLQDSVLGMRPDGKYRPLVLAIIHSIDVSMFLIA